MTRPLIAVDPDALDGMEQRLQRMEAMLARLSPPDDWLTIPDAAARLGVSEATVRRKIRAGRAVQGEARCC